MCRLQNVDQTDSAGSAQTVDVDCIYQPSKGGVEEVYDGTLSTIGLDDPLKNQSVLAWVVRGPEDSDTQPGVLAQSYTAGAGTPEEPAQSLVGDMRKSIILLGYSPRHDAIALSTYHADGMRAVSDSGLDRLPFKKIIDRNKAASAAISISETG